VTALGSRIQINKERNIVAPDKVWGNPTHKKKKPLSVYDIKQLIQAKKITTRLELVYRIELYKKSVRARPLLPNSSLTKELNQLMKHLRLLKSLVRWKLLKPGLRKPFSAAARMQGRKMSQSMLRKLG